MEIATLDGWEQIVNIQKIGRVKTYDLQIEGTHNFLANDIVAHNTFVVSQAGNVGIGTTNPLARLQVTGDSGQNILTIDSLGNMKLAGTITSEAGAFDIAEEYPALEGVEEGDVVSVGHQKTALADGFNASIDDKPSKASPPELSSQYHKTDELSSEQENAPVDRTGFEPASSGGEPDSLPLTYRPEYAGASSNIPYIQKSQKPYDQKIIGIISTKPGVNLTGQSANGKPVALAGRVPVKVSLENGPIEVGDYLTSSSTPGVAMKALRPGQVVGKALEALSPDCNPDEGSYCQGKILAFVNVSYADPGNFFASLSFDNQGNLIIPKIKTASIILDQSVASASAQLTTDGSQLALAEDPAYFSTAPPPTQSSQFYDLSGKIASIEERLAALEQQVSSKYQVVSSMGEESTASATIVNEEEASDSASLATNYQLPTTDLDLTPPDILLYQDSAILSDLAVLSEATVSGTLTAYSADIQDHFRVFGETQLSTTQIAGDLTVDGTLSFENGSEINVLSGPLFLQRSSLAGGLDIFDGKISLDRDGTLKATSLIANQLKINDNQSAGRAKIPSGQTEAVVENPYVDENSIVLLTPDTPLSQTLGVTEKIRQTSTSNARFKVRLYQPEAFDIDFSYLIIGINKATPQPISQTVL